jgi:hypothetical protein
VPVAGLEPARGFTLVLKKSQQSKRDVMALD